MAIWLIGAYAAIELMLIAGSGRIALCADDPRRRQDAYKVLRLLITAGAASGLLGLLVKLHESGLL